MSLNVNPFAGMRDAKMYDKGVPLTPGTYALEVTKCLYKNTRKGPAFIVEFNVLATTNDAEHPKASKRSWFQKMTDLDVAHGSLKQFAAAIYGFDPGTQKDQIERELSPKVEKLMLDACDESLNIFKGKKVLVECVMTKTKDGGPFTRHIWTPCPADANFQ